MKKTIIVLILSFFSLLITIQGYSQLSLKQLASINYGETFLESRPKIESLFTQKPEIYKADFLGAYKIEYINTPFNYFGKGDYKFQYVKDTLVASSVRFLFKEGDSLLLKRLLNSILEEIKNDNSIKFNKEYSDLNLDKVYKYVQQYCRTIIHNEANRHDEILTKFLGQNIWDINNGNIFSGNFLCLKVALIRQFGSKPNYLDERVRYSEGIAEVTIEIFNKELQHLKYMEMDVNTISYGFLREPEENIKLQYKDGVYLLPVKLNNVITIDFVLDLGAADISISPDIYLVLYRAGTITDVDFIGEETYQFADGTTAKSSVFNIKSLQIGNKILTNVRASISNSLSSPLLLGQSALKKIGSYRIDNFQKTLIIE